MLKLYFAPGSSSLASHIALEEAGARFETQLVDEHGGEHKRPAYLAINPRGKVPALRLPSGGILVENTAILAYVARTHPDAGLLPRGAEGEARALSLMAFFASAVHPAFAHFYAPRYGGHCAWAMAQGYTAPGDPLQWRIVEDRLYVNYDAAVQRRWVRDIPGFIAAADRNWPGVLAR